MSATAGSISQQMGVCPQCCEHVEPLFGKHVCQQPHVQVGYLYTIIGRWHVQCTDCGVPKCAREVPLLLANLGQYRQPCYSCGKEINPQAHLGWPVLFE